MKKNRNKQNSIEINIIRVIGWILIICVLIVLVISFTPYRVGPVQKLRGKVFLEYVGIIKDKRSNSELIEALKSRNEVEQMNAITAMAYRSYSSQNAHALLEYLNIESVSNRMKNIAVWALGELHALEAKDYLYSLRGNENFSQYEVNKAIKKIEGKISKPFWRK